MLALLIVRRVITSESDSMQDSRGASLSLFLYQRVVLMFVLAFSCVHYGRWLVGVIFIFPWWLVILSSGQLAGVAMQ